MKKIILIFTFIISSQFTFGQTQELFFKQSNEFLKKYVNLDGRVNYASFKTNPGEIIYIFSNIANLKLDATQKDAPIAFWINVYNLLVIKNVIESYPVKSVNFIPGFFDKKTMITGIELSLNDIKTLLKYLIKDPGMHFVLTDGTVSGPKILNAAYYPETVVYQVSLQVKNEINKPNFVKINKEAAIIEIPKVFELYKSDFVTNYYNEIDFMNLFLDKKLDNKLKIFYANSDVNLNEFK